MLSLKVVIVFLACMFWSNCECSQYCSLCEDHTMCQYPVVGPKCKPGSAGVTAAERNEIVETHNRLRRQVANGQESRGVSGGQPKAADLNKIVWDKELAAIAQRWANQCKVAHDTCRHVQRFKVGQNLFWESTATPMNWTKAVEFWYNEVKNFDKQNLSKYKFNPKTGHYTQVIWHSTYTIGCGLREFGKSRLAVCNYGPSGNFVDETIYTVGAPCSSCPAGATCEDSLCRTSMGARSSDTGSVTQGPVKSAQQNQTNSFRIIQEELETL